MEVTETTMKESLAEVAEWPEDIDIERAKERERARKSARKQERRY